MFLFKNSEYTPPTNINTNKGTTFFCNRDHIINYLAQKLVNTYLDGNYFYHFELCNHFAFLIFERLYGKALIVTMNLA